MSHRERWDKEMRMNLTDPVGKLIEALALEEELDSLTGPCGRLLLDAPESACGGSSSSPSPRGGAASAKQPRRS